LIYFIKLKKKKDFHSDFEMLPRIGCSRIYTLPNILTLSRMTILSPSIAYCITTEAYTPALSLLAVAAFTDWLDGYLARTLDQNTVLGSILDPAADKILMTSLILSLGAVELVPIPLAALIVSRYSFTII
jgi:cardiolipin synthase